MTINHPVAILTNKKTNALNIYCDILTSLTDDITSTVSVTPIVTYDAENAFAYDTSASEKFTLSFERNNPANPNDSSLNSMNWSNRKFKYELTELINRWQARTDGNRFRYNTTFTTDNSVEQIPDETVNSINEFEDIDDNVYIRSISISYKCGEPDHISGSISLVVGSMKCRTYVYEQQTYTYDNTGQYIPAKRQSIMLSSSDTYRFYPLFFSTYTQNQIQYDNTEYGCIDSCIMKCGPMQPFPYAEITISKKRLANIAPELIGDIFAGSNQLIINAVGSETMIVTKCSLSNNKYKIVAYAIEEAYRGIKLDEDIVCNSISSSDSQNNSPIKVIETILTKTYDIGNGYSVHIPSERIHYCVRSTNVNEWIDSFTFTKNTKTLWQILSLCALKLNAQIYFMGGHVYIIDQTLDTSDNVQKDIQNYTQNVHYVRETDMTYLNTIQYEQCTDKQIRFMKSIVDSPSFGDEGTDSLINRVIVEHADGTYIPDYSETGTLEILKDSVKRYNMKTVTLDIKPMKEYDAWYVSMNYARRLCDTQQSVSFTIAETTHDNGWHAYYPPMAYLSTVIDHNTDTYLTNRSTFSYGSSPNIYTYLMPQKLALSTITRNFPEYTSTYEFGVMANTDLTQSMSVIMNAIGG